MLPRHSAGPRRTTRATVKGRLLLASGALALLAAALVPAARATAAQATAARVAAARVAAARATTAQATAARVNTDGRLLSVDPFTNSFSAHQTEVEPDVTAHGSTIVSAFQVGRVFGGGSADIGWATSLDGGLSWHHGFFPFATISGNPPGPLARASDASVAYDVRHRTWLVSWLGVPSITAENVVNVMVSRSPDGLHWSAPAVVAARNEFLDKNWTACDNSRSSGFFGRCYTEFEDVSEHNLIFMATSADGGLTWPTLGNTADKAHGVGGQPVVQPDGRVIVPINTFTASTDTISSFVSDDGGASWSATHLIADLDNANDAGNIRDGGGLPSARIDGAGRVYTVWSDCRFEAGCATNDIVLSTSGDGLTWSPPALIPIDPAGSTVDHFTPGLGVDPGSAGANARLALTYYYYPQANCTVSTCQLNVGFISSADGGSTWSRSRHVAGPMMVDWLAPTSSGFMAGDYIGSAFVPGTPFALGVFAAATPPDGTLLHENMYAAFGLVTGGPLAARTGPVRSRPGPVRGRPARVRTAY